MSNKLTIVMCLFCLLCVTEVNAQYMRVRGSSGIGGSFFGSDTGQGLKVDYRKYLSSTFLVSPALFYEWGKPMQSDYSNIGADIMVGTIPFDLGHKLNFSIRAGLTGGYEKLTGLQNDITGFSFGGKGGGELEFMTSETLSISTYAYQAYLLKKVFGSSYYHIGIGFKINLYNY